MVQPVKRIVFEGQTNLGYRVIHEGDIVEFKLPSFFKGTAFYSETYTPGSQRDKSVSMRLDDYNYGVDPQNCHTFKTQYLVSHIPSRPKEVKRSGFGKWIANHV